MKQFVVARSADKGTPFSIDGDTFMARPASELPGGALLDLTAAAVLVSGTVPGTEEHSVAVGRQVAAMSDFLHLALDPDSVELLDSRLRDSASPLPMGMVAEVVNWLLEEVYSGRPTVPPAPSGNGRRRIGETSTPGAPAKDSTRSRSRATAS